MKASIHVDRAPVKQRATCIPLVDLGAQYESIRPEIDAAIGAVLREGAFVGGPAIGRFEQEFASYCGARHVIGVANGTDALEIVLKALDIGPGDEVLVPTMTFAATAEAVVSAGARPVFVDCLVTTLNMDPADAERRVTPRTKAIIAVHLHGQPADMDALGAMAREHSLPLIEDAAQAHGARWSGHRVGTLGTAACFSFYPGKNLGAYGDAGAVATSDDALAKKVRMVANHGRTDKYVHALSGRNSRLDTLQAAVLNVKLNHLEAWTARRRSLAARYRLRLGSLVSVVEEDPRAESVYHLFVVLVDRRDEVQEDLRSQGIATGIHYPVPLHRQPAFSAYADEREATVWAMDAVAPRLLSLPLYPELRDADVDLVARLLLEFTG